MAKTRQGDFVFPGGKVGRPLSNMAFLMLLRRMGKGDLTAHGFRSTFRDWCAEATNFPSEVAEMALAATFLASADAGRRDLVSSQARSRRGGLSGTVCRRQRISPAL